MAKGFTDEHGNFRPTGNKNRRSARDKSMKPVGTLMTMIRKPEPSHSQLSGIIERSFNDSRFASGEDKISVAEKEAFERGFDRGLSFANGLIENLGNVDVGVPKNQVDILTTFGDDTLTIDNKNDLREAITERAFENEENDRQFSPFEITAKEIDDSMFDENGEQINDAWDAFTEGIGEGILFGVEQAEIILDRVPEDMLGDDT